MHYFYKLEGLELNYFNGKIVLTFVLEMQCYDNILHWEHFYIPFFFFK